MQLFDENLSRICRFLVKFVNKDFCSGTFCDNFWYPYFNVNSIFFLSLYMITFVILTLNFREPNGKTYLKNCRSNLSLSQKKSTAKLIKTHEIKTS